MRELDEQDLQDGKAALRQLILHRWVAGLWVGIYPVHPDHTVKNCAFQWHHYG